jgi:tRNA (Thr-GGU) A37 N-methylase
MVAGARGVREKGREKKGKGNQGVFATRNPRLPFELPGVPPKK